MKSLLTENNLRKFIQKSIVESAITNPNREILIGDKRIRVEVAENEMSRNMGMMFRRELEADKGMLFIFEDSAPRRFWMKNTFVPLSIAYISAEGKIINISEMSPLSESGVWSLGPAKYALEMNKGWFLSNGICPGDFVKI
ncbi:MAG: hypothetical protein CML56_08545 [Rhodobacteraceae bacterium]|nr:hypothetical protein [Paracoccaceae bacterium]|tara:strand:+ start:1297 stop:1719 length:423 start_codon:yes stop_codon:yes gene_type:complete